MTGSGLAAEPRGQRISKLGVRLRQETAQAQGYATLPPAVLQKVRAKVSAMR